MKVNPTQVYEQMNHPVDGDKIANKIARNGNPVSYQESLRVELAQQVQSAELLAEERNSYRTQVLEMNSALKNSLEHIKELREVFSSPVSHLDLCFSVAICHKC